MAYDPAARLKNHVDSIVGQTVLPVQYLEILRLVRLLIEHEGSSSKYPVAHAYCNWMMHTTITKDEDALKILGLIDSALFEYAKREKTQKMHSAPNVIAAFRLDEFGDQLINLFYDKGINKNVFTKNNGWMSFLKALFEDLCDRPIFFSDKVLSGSKGRGKEIYDAMLESRRKFPDVWEFLVAKVLIVRKNQDEFEKGSAAGYYWNFTFMQHGDRLTWVGSLLKL